MTTATKKKERETLPFGLIVEGGKLVRATLSTEDFRALLERAGLATDALDTAVSDSRKRDFAKAILAIDLPSAEDIEITEDIAAYDAARTEGGEHIPGEVVDRLIDGEHPIKAFREWRGLNQKELAAAISTAPNYLSQIETGARGASNAKIRSIADALNIDFAMLVDWCNRPADTE